MERAYPILRIDDYEEAKSYYIEFWGSKSTLSGVTPRISPSIWAFREAAWHFTYPSISANRPAGLAQSSFKSRTSSIYMKS